MVVLREDQLRAFDSDDDSPLATKIARKLRWRYSDLVEDLSDAVLEHRVLLGIERAKTHDIQEAGWICAFVTTMFAVGPAFDAYPPVMGCFNRKGMSGDEQFRLVFATITPRQWQGAKSRSQPAAWG